MKDKQSSYMKLCLHLEEQEDIYLLVPTFWDSVKKGWVGFIKTPKTYRLIYGVGKNSVDLQNSFNQQMSKLMHESAELGEEIYDMFKPLSYWER